VASLLEVLKLRLPIIQAPMAGTSTPALAAAVTNAGGLGSLGIGATDAGGARSMIEAIRAQTTGSFHVNVFCHRPAQADAAREHNWLSALGPVFERHGAKPPAALKEIYRSFIVDDAMLNLLLETRPHVVSFHFGLPSARAIGLLKSAGITLFSSATTVAEAECGVAAGMDAIIAQGYEAGGHRGVFDPTAPDSRLGIFALTRLLVSKVTAPIIAAGGIMDGAGIAAALNLGAVAAQLGTAFIACPESSADEHYRAALSGPGATRTEMTALISGRPARCLPNMFTDLKNRELAGIDLPDYPIVYDAGKALNAAAKARGVGGFGAHWAGQGAPLARFMPAGRLVETLALELAAAVGARTYPRAS
jgi:nitronate monooxygenase